MSTPPKAAGANFKHLTPISFHLLIKTSPSQTQMPILQMQPIMSTLTNNNIRQMVAQAIQVTLAKGYPNWQATPRSPSPPINAIAIATFKAQDIGYFDPSPSKNAVEIKENHTVYYNIFSFTKRF